MKSPIFSTDVPSDEEHSCPRIDSSHFPAFASHALICVPKTRYEEQESPDNWRAFVRRIEPETANNCRSSARLLYDKDSHTYRTGRSPCRGYSKGVSFLLFYISQKFQRTRYNRSCEIAFSSEPNLLFYAKSMVVVLRAQRPSVAIYLYASTTTSATCLLLHP